MAQKQSNKKRNTVSAIVILLVLVVVIILGYYVLSPILLPERIAVGDCADVLCRGSFASNGTVFDNTWTIPAHIFVDPARNHTIPSGYLNYSSSKVIGLLKALVGMKAGDTKTVNITPKYGFGTWNVSAAIGAGIGPYPLDSVINTTIVENISVFVYDFPDVNAQVNTTFDYGYVVLGTPNIANATIIAIDATNVTYKIFPKDGVSFILPIFNWTATFHVYNSTQFTLHSDVQVNHTFAILDFVDPMYFKVISVNATSAVIGMNLGAPSITYVDQPLIYEIKVLKVYKTSQ
jgi:FKBP-type peptidyl-prolyl cis-trans isomerase 2